MRIEHIAIWVKDLEVMKAFYTKYFSATATQKYHNPKKRFSSYFLSFEGGCRIELMHRPDINENGNKHLIENIGLAHFAISVGSKERVDEMTEELRNKEYTIIGEPRTTGDGYYESVTLDPEGNRIEITV